MEMNPQLKQVGLLLGPLVLISVCVLAAFWVGRAMGGSPEATAVAVDPGVRPTATLPLPTASPTSSPSPTSTTRPTRTPTPLPTATPTPVPTATPIVRPGPIRDLGQLTTAEQEFTVWLTYESKPPWWPDWLPWKNKIIMIAVGDVQAGIDLEKLRADDIVADGTSVAITLPPPEFFGDPNLDLDRIEILEGSTFNPFTMDPNDIIKAQQDAETAIERKAEETELLETARRNAETQLELLLRRLGATEVTITWRDFDK